MAWLDDRIWCHPKLADLPPNAAWVYVKSIAYSSGMNTAGHLTAGQQALVGSSGAVKRELIAAGLWDLNGDGNTIVIHDWDEHNGARDERRERERERLREYRRKQREEGR